MIYNRNVLLLVFIGVLRLHIRVCS